MHSSMQAALSIKADDDTSENHQIYYIFTFLSLMENKKKKNTTLHQCKKESFNI